MKTNVIEPKVELKKVKIFRGHDGYGMNADVYIDGYKCLFVVDDGCGGEFSYENYALTINKNPALVKKINDKIQELKDYIDSLPAEPIIIDGNPYTDKNGVIRKVKINLDTYLDELLEKQTKEKELKKMRKLFYDSIVFGKSDAVDVYSYCKFKQPLDTYDRFRLQKSVNQIAERYCEDNGYVILNTNLEKLGITNPTKK